MAELIKRELGVEVELVEGDEGEFTVWVDDTMVATMVVKMKFFHLFPEDQEVLSAVRHALAT